MKLVFGTASREIFSIEIKDREIFLTSRKCGTIKVLPEGERIPDALSSFFPFTDEEKKEYNDAKTDEELAEICIKDTINKGARLLFKNG